MCWPLWLAPRGEETLERQEDVRQGPIGHSRPHLTHLPRNSPIKQ